MLADAGGLIALYGEAREDALSCFAAIESESLPLFVTPAVLAETHRRLLFDFGTRAAQRFLEEVPGDRYQVIGHSLVDLDEARAITERYADQRITLSDALSFAAMKRLGILRAFTYDRRHFWLLGFVTVPPI